MHCPACGGKAPEELGPLAASDQFAGRRLDHPLPPATLYGCPDCGLWFRYPLPDAGVLSDLYAGVGQDQWQHADSGKLRRDWQAAREWLRARATDSLLDVGCFDGEFLAATSGISERCGIERNSGAAGRARGKGVEILGNELESLSTLSRRFDVVTAFDVIEHVRDPRRFLADAADRLRPRGRIMLATGNRDAWSWRLMGSHYYYCTLPEHCAFLCPRWVRQEAERIGLKVVDCRTYSHVATRFAGKLRELTTNLAWRAMPAVFAFLRRQGFGDRDAARHPDLAAHPPMWSSARDHFIVLLEKP
ncbi:MAG: class I SAM-dependent methyltransferase [Gammaproteobacteria bacterium]|nr:class I SAM-dependent methyltransferase [Gammaproteobacteria bacterium]